MLELGHVKYFIVEDKLPNRRHGVGQRGDADDAGDYLMVSVERTAVVVAYAPLYTVPGQRRHIGTGPLLRLRLYQRKLLQEHQSGPHSSLLAVGLHRIAEALPLEHIPRARFQRRPAGGVYPLHHELQQPRQAHSMIRYSLRSPSGERYITAPHDAVVIGIILGDMWHVGQLARYDNLVVEQGWVPAAVGLDGLAAGHQEFVRRALV